MALYQAVRWNTTVDFDSLLKTALIVFGPDGGYRETVGSEIFQLAQKFSGASGAAVSLPSLQVGGTFTEAVEIKIQIGGEWKDLSS